MSANRPNGDEGDGQTVEVDAVVVGLGPGGEDVAGKLAEAGLSVVGIDRALVGGECPYWGCIPTKMMIRASGLLAEARRVPGMAGTAEVTSDWSVVARRIRDEATDDWDDRVAVERLEGKGARFVRGRGRLLARDLVVVDGTDGTTHRFRARRAVVIGTGTQPAVPPIDGLAGTPYWTNHEAIEAEALPASMIVLGGGAIGVELAQVMARFGVAVSVVEAAPRLVNLDEPEAGELLAEAFEREGITVVTGSSAQRVDHDGAFHVTLSDGRVLDADGLLVAVGRRADLAAFGASAIGVDVDHERALPVDEHLRVTDGVWAVGDVTGQGAFTHVSMYQAAIVVADVLGRDHAPASYHALPRVTFTDPEIGSVGMTAHAAIEAGLRVSIGATQVPSTARGWIHRAGNEGFIKLVADRDAQVLVGATVMGPSGGEVLGLLTLAVHARIPLEQLRTMIYAYPTIHRGVEDALRDMAAQDRAESAEVAARSGG